MKTLKNWKKFNEDMWTSTSTADYQEPSQVQAQAQAQTQVQETPAVDSVIFKIPAVYQIRLNEEKAFGYATDIDEVVSNLTEQGFEDSYWVKEQYEYWYKSKLRDMGNREDDNDGEDYHELDFSDSFNEWIEEEFRNWVKFIEQFNTVESCENLDRHDSNNIYEILMDSFNSEKLEQYYEDGDYIQSIRVIGDDFDFGCITVEVKTSIELEDEDVEEIENYLIEQCSDGFGESFEQREVEGKYISMWNDNDWEIKIIK